MLLIGRDLFIAGLLLLTGVHSLPTADLDTTSHSLAKRGVKFDKNCDKKYGTKSAQQWLKDSWDLIEPLSKAGHDGFENIVKLIEFKAGISKIDPKISDAEQLRLVPLYEIMFGEIEKDDATKTLDKADVAKHVTRVNTIMQSLKRLEAVGQSRKPNLNMHCDDDFLQTKDLKNKPYSGPAAGAGKVWRFNTDSKEWEQFTNNGKICVAMNAGVTFIKKEGQTTAETMIICPDYFEIQVELEKKDQPHLWELDRNNLPKQYWNMGENKIDDYHMAAFGRKIGMKLFHEMMHTSFFHPTRNYFKDQFLVGPPKKKAYTFVGAAELAAENKDLAAKNIDNVVYWSIANYFEKYHWETGYARLPATESQPQQQEEAGSVKGKTTEKRNPRGGRSGSGRGGSGGGLGGGSKPSTKKIDPPASTPPPPPASTPAPPVSTPAPPASTPAPPVSTPAPPASTAAPPPSSSRAPPPSSSSIVQESSSSQAVPPSSTAAPLSTLSSASTSATSAPNTITTLPTQTTLSTTSKPCSGTLCSTTGTASHSSSSSTRTQPAITLTPDPITADDVKIAAASKAEASVHAWEAAGAGALALWGLSEVVPTGVGEVGTGTASAGSGLPTAGAENGTFSVDVKPRSTVVPRMEAERGERSWWMRYLF